ncbi:MAG: hypothetical protein IKD05_07015 [Tidjanibacter sp.]|nr:hypothetical protein [Tidjanibacter sp.]MBR7130006.1 hypothetical protein [Tidjanibacter sp.]
MKKEIVMASMAMLLASAANAQENTTATQNEQQVQTEQQAEKKDGFFKRAFRDMKESARLQRKIDKANYEATKLESKAFYQEQKRLSNPKVRTAAEKARMEQELQAANERKQAAQAKLDSIRNK